MRSPSPPRFFRLALSLFALWPGVIHSQSVDLRLSGGSAALPLPRIESTRLSPGQVLELEGSADLVDWSPYATVRTRLAPYPLATDTSARFFRLGTRPASAQDDWTNQLDLDAAPFFAPSPPANTPFVKFTLPLDDPARRVFFQDSQVYPFHYHFIVARLPGHALLTLAEFERRALFRAEQTLLLGSLLLAPDPSVKEAAIQFVGQEVYPVAQIADWFDTVRLRLASRVDTSWRLFYMPSFEQRQNTLENSAFFSDRQIRVASASRWITSNTCYASGWAFGRLVFVPGDEIHTAYGEGRLRNADILLTDAVPAEIPVVAGVLALTPATPNSHVAILARGLRLPFAFASGLAVQEQLQSLDGREILLVVAQAPGGAGTCTITTTDTTNRLSPEERQAITDLKKAPAPEIRPKTASETFFLPVENLTPDAVDRVGGKAANFGLLRVTLPDHSPAPALALTFDLWDAYLDQPFLPGHPGTTLRAAIANRLQGISYPPELPVLRPALADIRSWIEERSTFTADQQSAILQALAEFDPTEKLRFRSSTNVEDSEAFSGAGLYDSFSGCLADDTDADTTGPSHCDGSQDAERGVFRAIRRVYASFYNENAFVERLRHGIPEDVVGMAILVHHSFPDSRELANGVATLQIHYSEGGARQVSAQIVTQLGAESVTNPDGGLQPEIVVQETALRLQQASSLTDGATVMAWPADYAELLALLNMAAQAYEALVVPTPVTRVLDFEFKKMKSTGLVVKQIRTIPQPPHLPPPTLDF